MTYGQSRLGDASQGAGRARSRKLCETARSKTLCETAKVKDAVRDSEVKDAVRRQPRSKKLCETAEVKEALIIIIKSWKLEAEAN